MVKKYIPKRGDIGYVNLNPTKCFEQKGIRPAIVISNDVFNKYSNMIVVLPITSNVKEFPTHYLLEDTKKIQGSVLCEHVRSIDYNERKFKYVESASENDLISVLTLFQSCFDD